ncbi:MAG: DNA-binding protein [Candidatus Woesearchaeota archaeon]
MILDTNFLLIPSEFNVDIFSELKRIINENFDIFLYQSTFNELNNIIEKERNKYKKAAKIALMLIKQKNLKTLPNSLNLTVDEAIIENSIETDIVCTQDIELKKKLKQKKIRVITLKRKKYLDFV